MRQSILNRREPLVQPIGRTFEILRRAVAAFSDLGRELVDGGLQSPRTRVVRQGARAASRIDVEASYTTAEKRSRKQERGQRRPANARRRRCSHEPALQAAIAWRMFSHFSAP
jgi:hypothetical protein